MHRQGSDPRFWALVSKGQNCWEWQGCKTRDGYGRVNRGNHVYKAHRHSYELAFGPIPDGLEVMHTCDNPACVRPDHLHLGTHAENICDMVQKGRARQQKLSIADVQRIRAIYVPGRHGYKRIARQFNVSPYLIRNIITGRAWAHLPLEKGGQIA